MCCFVKKTVVLFLMFGEYSKQNTFHPYSISLSLALLQTGKARKLKFYKQLLAKFQAD